MLCAKCISIFQNVNKTQNGYHHETVNDLVKAAKLGCRICIHGDLIREQLGISVGSHTVSERLMLRYEFRWIGVGDSYSWLYFGFGVRPEEITFHVDFQLTIHVHETGLIPVVSDYQSLLKSAKKDLKRRPWNVRRENFETREISSNTEDEAAIKVAGGWLRECRESHKSCDNMYSNRRSGWYPKRIIAVGDNDNEIRLVLTAEEKAIGGYATLSHCWGNDPSFLTLTSDNHDGFRNKIPVAVIPKSFQDAIYACRRLGIKYLWIDSLCIKQSGKGSDIDWLYHTAEMEMIYLNCILNLAIVHGSNPHNGAFVDRNPEFLQDCQIWAPRPALELDYISSSLKGIKPWQRFRDKITNLWGGSSTICRRLREHFTPEELRWCGIFVPSLDFSDSRENQPLTSRGWVLQERLLSPRTLHFQIDRIAWECQEAIRNEYFPSGLPCDCDSDPFPTGVFNISPEVEDKQPHPTNSESKEVIPTARAVPSPACIMQYWNLVEDYTKRELSFPAKDKLVAFSAVAKLFGPAFGNSYMAGIFRQDMPRSLLWTGSGTRRQEQWRAPSWSWASVDGIVNLKSWATTSKNRKELAEVEDVNTELVDLSNCYGQVTSARLHIRGVVLPWCIEQRNGNNNQENREEGQRPTANEATKSVESPVQVCGMDSGSDGAPNAKFETSLVELTYDNPYLVLGNHVGFGISFQISCDGGIDQDRSQLDECFLLPILEATENTSEGLLLLREDDGSYTRLGIYECLSRCIGLEAIENGAEKQLITIV